MITVAGIIVIAVIALVAKSLLAEEVRGWIDEPPVLDAAPRRRHLPRPREEDTLTRGLAPWFLAFEQHKAEADAA